MSKNRVTIILTPDQERRLEKWCKANGKCSKAAAMRKALDVFLIAY